MKHIVLMLRLTWRKLLTVLLAASSFLFGSCGLLFRDEYGPPPAPEYGVPYYETISGTVTDGEKPVSGFWVSLLNDRYSSPQPYTFTGSDGRFIIYVYENAAENGVYTVFFQDIDGPLNGEFNSKTVQWKYGDGP